MPRWLVNRCLQLPAHALNGMGVALGVLLVQALAAAFGDAGTALLASSGAIFASLADAPNPPHRAWRRLALAATVGLATSVLVSALRGHAVALGLLIALLAFGAAMLLAWGMRAGPISFVPVLAIVFTLTGRQHEGWQTQLQHAAWIASGAIVYLGWALLCGRVLQPRYRALALASVLQATAALFHSRARLLAAHPREAAGVLPLQDWMLRQTALDERLQPARDLLFAAPDAATAPDAPRHIALLLHAVALRDTLLGSELDLELLGDDAAAERLRLALSGQIAASATQIEALAHAVQQAMPPEAWPAAPLPPDALAPVLAELAGDLQRHALASALRDRARHIVDDLEQMARVWRGEAVAPPPPAAELQFFVSPEGWPLAALALHRHLASPILRHAVRSACALGLAYFLALLLPWTSHPAWLALSVAVVLRGNLDQTLARRDARVAGTVLGCLLVLLFAWLQQPWLSGVVFILSVGLAHAYVNVRYLVTAAAATVMALLQAHMAHPDGGFAITERLADTLLGAALAWAFCYVLPAWERRGLQRLLARVQAAARALAAEALRWPEGDRPLVALRLARREFYEAIGSLAASAQRSRAEPERVQLPLPAMATLLTRCHVLLAQLSAVRTLLERRRDGLDPAVARSALVQAAEHIDALLAATSAQRGADADTGAQAGTAARNGPAVRDEGPDPQAPLPGPGTDLMPWLQRRLLLVAREARATAAALAAVHAADRQG